FKPGQRDLATEPSPQRAYRAACPNCGAAVEFRSAASASAVCSYCRSTLVREGEALRRIGESAELFDDHTPLQLGASGRYSGEAFTLIGRVQLAYAEGTWNEWHALFDNGRGGWLSEDNGAYVVGFDAPLADGPSAESLRAGSRCQVAGQAWDVAAVASCHVQAAEGELPAAPKLQGDFIVADLRNERGEVGTLEYRDPQRPAWSVGRSVRLAELTLRGLREVGGKTLTGRGFNCPNCGAAVEVKLAGTLSLTCGQCQAVIDVSQGPGADLAPALAHYAQTQGTEPLLALGRTGRLALDSAGSAEPLPWQVVGYLERCDVPAPGSEDEQTFWREYLLYNTTEGFAFLVDAEDGWSWVRPLTGAPVVQGTQARWAGDRYDQRWPGQPFYEALNTYVLGEFYWRVRRGERAQVTDYAGSGKASSKRLSRERTPAEVTWSGGQTLGAATVADAFNIPPAQRSALMRDAAPISSFVGSGGLGWKTVVIGLVLVFFLMLLLTRCGSDDCGEIQSAFGATSAEYQQCLRSRRSGSSWGSSGGSWGGYSSGGGGSHK
ncbi:MAG: DUF4178 domain-containing protein, partial [Burkholderiales bacterium]